MITNFESIGASIATVLSQLVVDIIQFWYIRKDFDVKQLFKLSWKYLVSGLVMFALCMGAKVILDINWISEIINNISMNFDTHKEQFINIVTISIQVIVGIITYFVMLIILKDDYVFKFLDKIKNQILKRKS